MLFLVYAGAKMSWQIAPGLIIIGGAFSAVGGIFAGVDWLSKKFYDQVSF